MLHRLGPFSPEEKRATAVFLAAAAAWILVPFRDSIFPAFLARQLAWLDEYVIGIAAGAVLFFLPTGRRGGRKLLEWSDTSMVEWGILILFGGGIALSDAMFRTGLAAWLARAFVSIFGSPSTLVLIIVVTLLAILLTEVTSNTAVTSMLVPVVISVAGATGANPVSLTLATALGASLAFMLPVATPPNALVYSSGYIKLKEMVKAGAVLDFVGWIFTVVVVSLVASFVLGLFAR
jgi:sodium-dependent dicarboxylate transporter 2/3/5